MSRYLSRDSDIGVYTYLERAGITGIILHFVSTEFISIHSFVYIRTSIFLAEAEPKPNVLIFLAI